MTLGGKIVAASVFSCIFLLTGCGGGSSTAPPPPPPLSASCTVNASSSPAPVLVGSLVSYNANPTSGSAPYKCDWNPGSPLPGAFDLPAGSSCAPGAPTYTPGSGGTYSENVIASDSGGHTVSLACPALTVQDFGISVFPPSASALPGGVVAYTVTASSVNGFAGDLIVNQSTSLPSGVTGAFSGCAAGKQPCTCSLPASGSCSATYSATVGAGVSPQNIGLVFNGSYAPIVGLVRTANATLQIGSSAAADKFAYLANTICFTSQSGCVYSYTIDSTTGVLKSAAIPITAADAGSKVLSVDPLGKFLYVGNSSDVSMFTIDPANGALAPIPPGSVAGGSPEWIGVHPSSKFAYLANDSSATIDVYSINLTTGALTQTSSVPACIQMFFLSAGVSAGIDPSGKFLFVPEGCSFDDVLTFSIEQTTGALTLTGTPASGATEPVGLAVHPSGSFVYLLSTSPDVITTYTVSPSGLLTTFGNPVPAGSLSSAIAVDPSGKFAYVANSGSNDVSEYSIDQTTGALTNIGSATGITNPVAMTIEHSGKFLYVVSPPPGCGAFGGRVQAFAIGTAGQLTAIGNPACADLEPAQIVTAP